MKGTTRLGREGERIAEDYLVALGWRILERRYRFSGAEVDLVCLDDAGGSGEESMLVFVEVKTRSGTRFGWPEEAVDAEKRRRITRAARAFLYEHRMERARCRFDVVAVMVDRGEPQIEHFRDAFWDGQ